MMKKRILHDLKVVFLTFFVTAIVLLIIGFICLYVDGYRYYAVYKVGSIDLNYEFGEESRYIGVSNLAKDDVLRCMGRYCDYIQDEEEYRKLYQEVEEWDDNTIFVISRGAPILYIRYYSDVDELYCSPQYGKVQSCRLYIYRVNRRIPEIG